MEKNKNKKQDPPPEKNSPIIIIAYYKYQHKTQIAKKDDYSVLTRNSSNSRLADVLEIFFHKKLNSYHACM